MRSRIPSKLSIGLFIGLVLAAVSGAAIAQTANQSGQTPPPEPEKGTTAQANCIKEDTNYRQTGGRYDYVITLANNCEAHMQCKINVSVMQAKGAFSGKKTLVLGPKSKGEAATKSYALKVAMAGGIAQSSRECKAL